MSAAEYEVPCRSCGEPVVFKKTKSGKMMPMNADGTSHFATCPDAAKWRKAKEKTK